MNAVFLTTGSTRTIKIGNRKVLFKHSAPRNFVYKGTLMPLIVEPFLTNVSEETSQFCHPDEIKKILIEINLLGFFLYSLP